MPYCEVKQIDCPNAITTFGDTEAKQRQAAPMAKLACENGVKLIDSMSSEEKASRGIDQNTCGMTISG